MTEIENVVVDEFKKKLHETFDLIKSDAEHELRKLIWQKKEPYLREVLFAMQNGSDLEKKYTASDILTILESIEENLERVTE